MATVRGEMPVHNFIEVALWNRARWRAAFFMHIGDGPPAMGLAFENGEAGCEIFRAWQKYFPGTEDTFNELRVAIVEGDVRGQAPGYSVHVSSNPEGTAKRRGLDYVPTMLVGSRIHRMNPSPTSPFLARFKADWALFRRYLFIPGTFDARTENVTPHVECAIGKLHIELRNVSELRGEDDPDQVVLTWRGDPLLRSH